MASLTDETMTKRMQYRIIHELYPYRHIQTLQREYGFSNCTFLDCGLIRCEVKGLLVEDSQLFNSKTMTHKTIANLDSYYSLHVE